MSSYTNFSITNRTELSSWILRQLGYPLVTVEITQDQLDDCINSAVEEFTKYVQQEQRALIIDLNSYNTSLSGILLPTNVTSVYELNGDTSTGQTDVSMLFSFSNQLFNVGTLPIPGTMGGSQGWAEWEMALQNLELIKRMTGGGFQFEFSVRDHYLQLIPDPKLEGVSGSICIGVNTIRPDDQQMGEVWVKKYALALAKIIVGTVRGKYKGTTLLGGGQINDECKTEGIAERDKLVETLRDEGFVGGFFLG